MCISSEKPVIRTSSDTFAYLKAAALNVTYVLVRQNFWHRSTEVGLWIKVTSPSNKIFKLLTFVPQHDAM